LPILTALLSVILGQTKLEGMKALGILISASGAVFMVVFDSRPSRAVATESGVLVRAVSHLIFFCNIAGTSSYFIIMNRFGNKYTPVQTVTWSIMTSISLLSVTAVMMFTFRPLHQVFCHADSQVLIERCMNQGLRLPPTVYFPLFYEVVICTLVAWPMLNWANQHTDPAVVSVYMGLHPAATTFICMAIVGVMGAPWAHQFHIGMPSLKDLGIVLIVLGLMVVFYCELLVSRRAALQEQRSKMKV
jgi:drug/metabolite transporter (DMT)-like permease